MLESLVCQVWPSELSTSLGAQWSQGQKAEAQLLPLSLPDRRPGSLGKFSAVLLIVTTVCSSVPGTGLLLSIWFSLICSRTCAGT